MCLAVPGRVTKLEGDDPLLRTALIDFGGISKRVSMACLPDAQLGDTVLVHAGVAITRLTDADADRLHQLLDEAASKKSVESADE